MDRLRSSSLALLVVLMTVSGLAVNASPARAEPAIPAPSASAVLAAGGSHTCALRPSGRLKCWGVDFLGALGLGDWTSRGDGPGEMGNRLPFVDLGTGAAVATVDAGRDHTCAVLRDGRVKCWGGPLGLGLGDLVPRGDRGGEMGNVLPFVALGAGRTATAISAGVDHTCAVLDHGAVKCWGNNYWGALGLGDSEHRGDDPGEMGDALASVDLGYGRTAVAVSAGAGHTCAVLDHGALKCWGHNDDGALGLGSVDDRGNQPGEMGDALPEVDLGPGRTATAVEAGQGYTCALLDDGSVKCWGTNEDGQLGLGDQLPRGGQAGDMGSALPAVDLGVGRRARAIAVGGDHSCALLDDGSVKCWGAAGLGIGDDENRGDDPGEMGDALPAVDLGTGRTATAIGTGDEHTCALLDDGTVKCWGENYEGQLGLGDDRPRGEEPGQMGDALPAVDLGGDTGPFLIGDLVASRVRVLPGAPIDHRLTITNVGTEPASGIAVRVDAVPACDQAVTDLLAGASATVECRQATLSTDAGRFQTVAEIVSDQTESIASNRTFVKVGPPSPDLSVQRRGGPWFGENVLNLSGEGQTVTVNRRRGGRVVFRMAVQDNGYGEVYRLRLGDVPRGLEPRFVEVGSGLDFTEYILHRPYNFYVPRGERGMIRIEVRVRPTARQGSILGFSLRAHSDRASSEEDDRDAVRMRVRVPTY